MRCANKMVRSVVKRTMRAIPRIGDSVFLREKEARRVKFRNRMMDYTYNNGDISSLHI